MSNYSLHHRGIELRPSRIKQSVCLCTSDAWYYIYVMTCILLSLVLIPAKNSAVCSPEKRLRDIQLFDSIYSSSGILCCHYPLVLCNLQPRRDYFAPTILKFGSTTGRQLPPLYSVLYGIISKKLAYCRATVPQRKAGAQRVGTDSNIPSLPGSSMKFIWQKLFCYNCILLNNHVSLLISVLAKNATVIVRLKKTDKKPKFPPPAETVPLSARNFPASFWDSNWVPPPSLHSPELQYGDYSDPWQSYMASMTGILHRIRSLPLKGIVSFNGTMS